VTEATHIDKQAEALGQPTASDIQSEFELFCESVTITFDESYLVDDMDGGTGKLSLTKSDAVISDMLNESTTLHEDHFFGENDIFRSYLIGFGQLHQIANCFGRLKTITDQFRWETKLDEKMEVEANNLLNKIYLCYQFYKHAQDLTVMPTDIRNQFVHKDALGTYEDFVAGFEEGMKQGDAEPVNDSDTIKSSQKDDLIANVTKRLETIASQRGDKYGITQPAVIWFLGLTETEQLVYNEKTSTGGVIGKTMARTKEKKAESFKNLIHQTLPDEEWEKSKQPLGSHPKYQEFVEMFPKEAVKGDTGSKELKGSSSPKGVKAPIMAAWLVENLEDLTSIQMSNDLEPYEKRPKGAMTAARLKAQKKRSQQKS